MISSPPRAPGFFQNDKTCPRFIREEEMDGGWFWLCFNGDQMPKVEKMLRDHEIVIDPDPISCNSTYLVYMIATNPGVQAFIYERLGKKGQCLHKRWVKCQHLDVALWERAGFVQVPSTCRFVSFAVWDPFWSFPLKICIGK